MNDETIEELIDEFLVESEYAANCFYKKFNRKDLLYASKDGTIEKSGKIEGLQHYAFHGIGLYARRKNCEIDFDFGLNDRIDGFDAWRLNEFAKSRKTNKGAWSNDLIQTELDRLEGIGMISMLNGDISSNYYKST